MKFLLLVQALHHAKISHDINLTTSKYIYHIYYTYFIFETLTSLVYI